MIFANFANAELVGMAVVKTSIVHINILQRCPNINKNILIHQSWSKFKYTFY